MQTSGISIVSPNLTEPMSPSCHCSSILLELSYSNAPQRPRERLISEGAAALSIKRELDKIGASALGI